MAWEAWSQAVPRCKGKGKQSSQTEENTFKRWTLEVLSPTEETDKVMAGRLCGIRLGFKEAKVEEKEDEFSSVEEMCKFMKVLLCYADDAKRGLLLA